MENQDEKKIGICMESSISVNASIPNEKMNCLFRQKAQPVPLKNTKVRIGRNQLCLCGSGKKFKQCCRRKHCQD